MKIKLKLHPSLKYGGTIPIKEGKLDIQEDTTIAALLETYGIKQSEVVVTLNKKILPKETVIEEEDFIEMYPILIGG